MINFSNSKDMGTNDKALAVWTLIVMGKSFPGVIKCAILFSTIWESVKQPGVGTILFGSPTISSAFFRIPSSTAFGSSHCQPKKAIVPIRKSGLCDSGQDSYIGVSLSEDADK